MHDTSTEGADDALTGLFADISSTISTAPLEPMNRYQPITPDMARVEARSLFLLWLRQQMTSRGEAALYEMKGECLCAGFNAQFDQLEADSGRLTEAQMLALKRQNDSCNLRLEHLGAALRVDRDRARRGLPAVGFVGGWVPADRALISARLGEYRTGYSRSLVAGNGVALGEYAEFEVAVLEFRSHQA